MRRISGKGSFRGIPFLLEDQQDLSGGRRLVQFEYPLRDDGLTEDLGLKLRNYHVSCLVIGDDYIQQAEKLIEALEQPDVGELKHPYFGTKNVRVEDYKTTYSTSEQRIARFDITFIPAINEIAPLAQKDTKFAALSQYAATLDALADEFGSMLEAVLILLDELIVPTFALSDVFLDLIDSVFEGGNTPLNSVSEYKYHLMNVKNRISLLVKSPQKLAKALQKLVKLSTQTDVGQSHLLRTQTQYAGLMLTQQTEHKTQSAVELKRHFVRSNAMQSNIQRQQATLQQCGEELRTSVLLQLAQSRKQYQPIGLTLTRLNWQSTQNLDECLQAKAQYLFMRLIQVTFALEYGNAIMQAVSLSSTSHNIKALEGMMPTAVESKADVQCYMADIDEQLETLVLALADNEQWQSYDALEQYRLALLNDLRTRGERLANSQKLILKDTQPALVVEFNANGNAKGWERLSLRNHIRHPLFCLGGTEMEVLQ